MKNIETEVLFPELYFTEAKTSFSTEGYTLHKRRKWNLNCHLNDYCNMSSTGDYDMPKVRPLNLGYVPTNISALSFNFRNSYTVNSVVWMHPFIDDAAFECVWNNPAKYIRIFKQAGFVTPADFSVLAGMPESVKIYNIYRNRFLERYYQDNGAKIVPNISWSTRASLAYCVDGAPRNSVIAINSNGIIGNKDSVRLWLQGYEFVINELNPELIFRYGEKIEGENEAISIYFTNENLRRLRNGR